MIPRAAPHRDNAVEFINYFFARSAAHLGYMRSMFYDTANREARAMLSPAELSTRFIDPENRARSVQRDARWLATNGAEIVGRWNTWIAR